MTVPRIVRSPLALLAALIVTVAASATPAAADQTPRLGPALQRVLATRPDQPVAVWVYFTDRAGAEHDAGALAAARERMTARSLDRRARRGALKGVVAGDLPVHEPYLKALVARGAKLRGASRWLNAASIEIPPRLAPALARLPFVARVDLVPTGRPMRPIPEGEIVGAGEAGAPESGREVGPSSRSGTPSPGDPAYYGGSFRQLDMMQIPALHALGLTGNGILVAMFDTGFHISEHEALVNLDVIAARDFINGDLNVDDPGVGSHGTWTVGCVAGSKPGTYSGGAFGATVALAATEYVPTETPAEMDYWQFAAEWADSLGADIISSSLGYTEFDNPGDSYTYADMDGRTTVVTLAAVEATRRGITVVNSAGNEGAFDWHYIVAPADADSIISVGAVDSFNVIQSFSSHGPTSDGRIKPDVTAMGRRVLLPIPTNPTAYERQSGTSFSCPLVSGLVALLLESHPTWGPVQVRDALRETALNAGAPNNDIGWGLVQGLAANAYDPVAGVSPAGGPDVAGLQLAAGPNLLRRGEATTLRFAASGSGAVTIDVVDISGRRRGRLFEGAATAERTIAWRGEDGDGAPLPAGIYWIRLSGIPSDGASHWPARTVRVVVLP